MRTVTVMQQRHVTCAPERHKRLIAVAAVFAAACAGPAQSATAAVQLAPHRAIYDIELARGNASNGVAELTGRLVYELNGSACAGWKQSMRFVTRTLNGEGEAVISDMRSSFEEDAGSTTFQFDSSNFRNRQLSERSAGTAVRQSAAEPGMSLELRSPDRKSLTFDRAAMFPMAHTKALIEAARAGKRMMAAPLFDGSDQGQKIFDTNAIIGEEAAAVLKPQLPPAENADKLDGLKAWPVSLSYFEQDGGKGEGVPSYELAFLLYENGVSRRLYIDYGAFAIRGKLKTLEMLTPAACKR